MDNDVLPRSKAVPAIVRIIVTQATRRRISGGITQAVFEEQIRRITNEELEPKNLTLLVRDLPGGRTRFIVKEKKTGAVCDLMQFGSDGTLESMESDGTVSWQRL
jgi:hypothetical protein